MLAPMSTGWMADLRADWRRQGSLGLASMIKHRARQIRGRRSPLTGKARTVPIDQDQSQIARSDAGFWAANKSRAACIPSPSLHWHKRPS